MNGKSTDVGGLRLTARVYSRQTPLYDDRHGKIPLVSALVQDRTHPHRRSTVGKKKITVYAACKTHRQKTTIHFHAFDTASTIEGPYSAVYKKLFDDADRVIVLSKMWENAVCSTFELGDKVRVLHTLVRESPTLQ